MRQVLTKVEDVKVGDLVFPVEGSVLDKDNLEYFTRVRVEPNRGQLDPAGPYEITEVGTMASDCVTVKDHAGRRITCFPQRLYRDPFKEAIYKAINEQPKPKLRRKKPAI